MRHPHADILHAEDMTLRDYFAAAALQGLIAATPEDNEFQSINSAARLAYLYADTMLKERERGE